MNNATVTSPVEIKAAASLVGSIDHMRAYVDGVPVYFTFYNNMDAQIWMSNGQHTVEVLGTDESGNNVSASFQLNVVSPETNTIGGLQNLPNWAPCSASFPAGDPRAGQTCAAGLGTAYVTLAQHQSSPSLSGSSAKFSMTGGSHIYSNELWTQYFAGGSGVSHFVYDLYFMIDQPDNVQALEFDLNQTFNNSRWTFGTECNFRSDGKWDVWDGIEGWKPTSVPCNPFSANQWNHLTWTFERVGNQVHYISVAINNQTYNLDLYYSYESYWTIQDIDVAFQMDGDYAQQPFNVWLDNVSLTAQ